MLKNSIFFLEELKLQQLFAEQDGEQVGPEQERCVQILLCLQL